MSFNFCFLAHWLLIPFSFITPTVLGQLGNSCAITIPESPVVNLDEPFTAYCIINTSCIADVSKVYWKTRQVKVPDSQYSVINETVSSVTFKNASMLGPLLTCHFMQFEHVELTLHGILLKFGYPPDKPTNLTCIMYDKEKMTCTWNPGKPTLLNTTYTLKHKWPLEEDRDSCIPQGGVNDTCTISKNAVSLFFINNIFSVEAKNVLGTRVSDEIVLDAASVVKPNAPVITSLVSTSELPNALKIMWDNPMKDIPDMKMIYNIRYRPNISSQWEQVPQADTASHRTSFTLQDLLPYTEYVVSLRCKLDKDSGYWSDWSTEKGSITPEATPSEGPEFWRQIQNAEGKRSVLLMWKVLDPLKANGKILWYTGTVNGKQKSLETFNVTAQVMKLMFQNMPLKQLSLLTTVRERSPSSRLVIPAIKNYQALPPEIKIDAFSKDNKLWLNGHLESKSAWIVIEWCIQSEINACNMQWQREPSNAKGAFFESERPASKEAYLQQGVPKMAPIIIQNMLKNTRLLLCGPPVSVDDQQGFIQNFTLTYKPNHGNLTSIRIDPSHTEYALTSLNRDTLYTIHLTAYTDVGGTDGQKITFTTAKFANGEVEAVVVSSCLVFLILLLVGASVCFSKRDLIKKHIWPNVPDPSKSDIAKWSPQTPSRREFNTKSNPFQDGSFTDVSVVEITADAKNPYAEQDIKPVDPLKKEKNTSDGLSSGIGGSSCMSSPQLSVSDSDETESAQNTSSTVQYSTVIVGYRNQQPTAVAPQTFSRSESTQPLLDCEEKPEDQESIEEGQITMVNHFSEENCPQEDGTDTLKALDQDQWSGSLQTVPNHPGGQIEVFERPVDSDINVTNEELKSYLPQIVRRGGYMPQ
ncbi:LOW QUALITY PROTEIN: interleukin-6 receptor subunit beta [Bombina bombina]|uniref:LOW QUALITY PROTEIN: interleukin-6 receptor subunit beta n=1 Tax=Bombina bombina TaxID=8345 RepID=UPI00235AF60E|nr:LOW QUALITY PROTEIN: interleukin-6 receptor subunit beta [Bombina bombina]